MTHNDVAPRTPRSMPARSLTARTFVARSLTPRAAEPEAGPAELPGKRPLVRELGFIGEGGR
ncbi:hypothetical protein [Kitasatospora sp. McL0602]|uniref:hypothetical protein n=1 Tax=Kitasatospora sp. McL0602 TaxID=3439530 RepID=UPI003F88CF42